MAKQNKEFELRMQGMLAAYEIVKEGGIEALEKDIRYRGLLSAPLNYTESQLDEFWNYLSTNLHTTFLTITLMALNAEFGFGEKRLHQFKERFDKDTTSACDMSWIGNHYVTISDYAKHLNEEFKFDINTLITDRCQESFDKSAPNYKKVELDRLVSELTEHGFGDAATWILEKWKDY